MTAIRSDRLAACDALDQMAGFDAFELAAAGMVLTDCRGILRRVNKAFAQMLGRTVEELVDTPFRDITSPDDAVHSQEIMRGLMSGALPTVRFDKRYLRPDGSPVWVDVNIRVLTDSAGVIVGCLTQGSDISVQKAGEAELRQQAQLFGALNDGVLVSDAEGELIDCNPALERLTGRGHAESLAGDDDEVRLERDAWVCRMRSAMAEGGWTGDVTFGVGAGSRITETTIIVVQGANAEIAGAIAVCRDVTEVRQHVAALKRAEQQAFVDARHDQLTGLPNRSSLADRWDQLMRSPQGAAGAALLMIDLDRFKEVNDTLGHHCGNELLIQLSRVLCEVVGENDTVVRLGGDEFAILAPGLADLDAGMELAERVRVAFDQPFRVESIDLDVEASIGVAVAFPGPDIGTVLRQADVAMYVAKRQGAGASAYDAATDDNSAARLSLLGELRGALTRHELVLHYQPKISVATGEIAGVEALVRWNHPTRGLIPPDDFIPMAERTGLIRPLTQYVLAAALAEERTWIAEGRPIPIAVNLSARNLLEDHLVEQIVGLLTRYGVPPSLLEVEITESSIMTEPARAREFLDRMRALGIRVSIDDFGAGYTSLAVLKNLPVSELKIDKTFIEAMTVRSDDAHIVQSVVQMSHNLGMTAVAEGVEDLEVLQALTDMGCDIVQGYLFSRPLTSEAFAIWLREH